MHNKTIIFILYYIMYQEQFFITSKWIILLLLIIIIFLYNQKLINQKYSIKIIIISFILSLCALYILFIVNQQPNIPLLKNNEILSPSSGYISDIKYDDNKITIMFILDFFDNHIQYIPYNGNIISDEYISSKYLRSKKIFILHPKLFPNFEESIRDNEKYHTVMNTDIGNIEITRIAGLIAPRVHTFIKEDQNVNQGDVMGLILFSSMVLLTIPDNIHLNIKEGDNVIAGETIIGDYN